MTPVFAATTRCCSRPTRSTEVAAATYRGGDEGIVAAWEALVRWIDDSGYRLVGDCRELYHEWHDEDASRNVMELQQPITR